jgi:hypothetical protein
MLAASVSPPHHRGVSGPKFKLLIVSMKIKRDLEMKN